MVTTQKLAPESEGREVVMDIGGVALEGTLSLPKSPLGLVLFAHGSGSSRNSPRNRYVAHILQTQRIGTLLFDLLTRPEESVDRFNGEYRFDIPFLAKRLTGATRWVKNNIGIQDLKVGYFGASTGAGAALMAAAGLPEIISAVVSRGGRPDLAGSALGLVHAPTLLLVGGHDEPVIEMNRAALAQLGCHDKKLVIIPNATHLFEEPGTLEQVARIASLWFRTHFMAERPALALGVSG